MRPEEFKIVGLADYVCSAIIPCCPGFKGNDLRAKERNHGKRRAQNHVRLWG